MLPFLPPLKRPLMLGEVQVLPPRQARRLACGGSTLDSACAPALL
jgi:hypothetical protein